MSSLRKSSGCLLLRPGKLAGIVPSLFAFLTWWTPRVDTFDLRFPLSRIRSVPPSQPGFSDSSPWLQMEFGLTHRQNSHDRLERIFACRLPTRDQLNFPSALKQESSLKSDIRRTLIFLEWFSGDFVLRLKCTAARAAVGDSLWERKPSPSNSSLHLMS